MITTTKELICRLENNAVENNLALLLSLEKKLYKYLPDNIFRSGVSSLSSGNILHHLWRSCGHKILKLGMLMLSFILFVCLKCLHFWQNICVYKYTSLLPSVKTTYHLKDVVGCWFLMIGQTKRLCWAKLCQRRQTDRDLNQRGWFWAGGSGAEPCRPWEMDSDWEEGNLIMKETHNKQSWKMRGLDLKKTHKKCSVMANLMNIVILMI